MRVKTHHDTIETTMPPAVTARSFRGACVATTTNKTTASAGRSVKRPWAITANDDAMPIETDVTQRGRITCS